MKNLKKILIYLAIIVAIIAIIENWFGIGEYKIEILLGIFGIALIRHSIGLIIKFRKYTLIKTKYDIIFRLINLLIGLAGAGFLIWYWEDFYDFGWLFLFIGLIGLVNGIAYQNSIQLRKKATQLIINYKHRTEKIIDNLDSIVYETGKITFGEKDRFIEVNDIKETNRNQRLLTEFFKINYPNVEIIQR